MEWYKAKQRAKQKAMDKYIRIYKAKPPPQFIRDIIKDIAKDRKLRHERKS